jgi:hypothetical protein
VETGNIQRERERERERELAKGVFCLNSWEILEHLIPGYRGTLRWTSKLKLIKKMVLRALIVAINCYYRTRKMYSFGSKAEVVSTYRMGIY